MPGFAPRMARIEGSATVAVSDLVARRRREGADVISFSLGEPDFDTPTHVRQAAKDALDAGRTHYTPGAGIPELREAVAATARREQGLPCEAGHVLATPAKQAVMMAFQALVGDGDEALVPDPGWVSYVPAIRWAGGTPVPVPLEEEAGFRMTPEAVAERVTSRTQVVVLNSPSNPTGGVNTPDDVRGIMELAADHDLWVVSDEIYRHLLYDGTHLSPASLDGGFERTVTIDGLSKSFAMTGWRTGWIIAPKEALREIGKLQSHSITHVTSFAQDGMVAALTGPQDSVARMRAAFQERRTHMVEGLRAIPGVSCAMPKGAFYAFPRFDEAVWGADDHALAMRLIEEAGVAATPGSAFGERGRGHLRFSYAAAPERITEGLRRIRALVA